MVVGVLLLQAVDLEFTARQSLTQLWVLVFSQASSENSLFANIIDETYLAH